MKKVLSPLNLGQNQLLFAVTHNLAGAPATPVLGQRYYDTTTSCEYYWNGAWVPTDARLRSGIPLSNLAVDPLARANHTGTQLAATISDFAVATRAVTAFPIGNLTVDPLARANHTGTQLAATISDLVTAVRAVTAFPITNLTTDPLARANHTGTQVAATISDFAATVQATKLNQFVAPVATVSMGGQLVSNVAAGVAATDAVNKGQLDSLLQGLDQKPAAMVATAAPLPACVYSNGAAGVGATLTASANGVLTVDAYAAQINDRILVKNEVAQANNGLYILTTLGTASVPFVLTRATGMDQAGEFGGAFVPVENKGASTANTLWLCNVADAITVGTTAVPFTQLNTPYTLTATNGVQIVATVASIKLPASSGLVADASGLYLDNAIAVKKYAAAVPAGSTATVITHNLGTLDVTVAVYEVATGDEVFVDVNHTSTNTITLNTAVAPTANQYRVVVHG